MIVKSQRDKKDKLRQGKLASRKAKGKRSGYSRLIRRGGRKGSLLKVSQERRIVGLLSCRGERKITIVSGGNRRQLAA